MSRDQDPNDDDVTDARIPYTGYLPVGGGWGWGWLPVSRGDADPAYAEEDYDGGTPDEDGGNWWDEGLITLLLIAGIVLFLFPEPTTSTLGVILIVIGVIAWLVDAPTQGTASTNSY